MMPLTGNQMICTVTLGGGALLVVKLFVPLHGRVVAEHHFPQCLAQVSQAGDVAVRGDMLPTEEEMPWKILSVK